ncbi:mucin-5AC-like isoform X2 [Paramacrobiotus metropolitanus]|uniref:mucin-5AC-like isoform X2 n=1 Tax=Paramacrobiotus metropolitanus TaxID=2943436 RepID=UPI0024456286|nr:mucin-5AC-like isoform X2 [Paramacrobiotus metropolitanus]
MAPSERRRPLAGGAAGSVGLVFLFLVSISHAQFQMGGQGGAPFQNNFNFNPQAMQQAPMMGMQQGAQMPMGGFAGNGGSPNFNLPDGNNIQKSDYVAPESPYSYRQEAFPETRQFFGASNPQQSFNPAQQNFNNPAQQQMPFNAAQPQQNFDPAQSMSMQMAASQAIPQPSQSQGPPVQFGMSDGQSFPQLPNSRFPEVSAPNMQFNAPSIPNFHEPEFDFSGLERLQAGMASVATGWPQGTASHMQANGPVGPGQMAVPGLPPNNPLQQLAFGSQLDDRLSAAPLDSGNGVADNQPSLFLNLQQGQGDFMDPARAIHRQNARQPGSSQEVAPAVTAEPEADATYSSSEESHEADAQQLLSASTQHMAKTGQEVIATVKAVPLDRRPVPAVPTAAPDRRPLATVTTAAAEAVSEEATTEAVTSAALPDIPPNGPTCGFHGAEKWKKSVCEECVCERGVTSCSRVQCTEKPPHTGCVPVYRFTQCCPTFQCNGTARGQVPSLEVKAVQDGDNCSAVGDFVPASVSSPCLACKCNSKLKIQCKTITCPPAPTETGCKERLPKNPAACCPEYDCLHPAGKVTSADGHHDEDDGDEDVATVEPTTTVVTKPPTTAATTQVTTEEALTTEEPMVIKVLPVTQPPTTVPTTPTAATTSTTASTTTTPSSGETTVWNPRRRRSTTTTTAASSAAATSTPATTGKARTTTTETATTDEEGGDDETTTWPAFRPAGAAIVHAPDAEADIPRAQQIRSQVSENNVALPSALTKANASTTTIPTTVATTSTTSTTTTKTTTTTTAATTAKPTTSTTTTTTTPTTTKTAAKVTAASASKGVIRDCQGGWKFPAGCDINRDCTYIARWRQNPMDQTVQFKITTRDADKWTGIGFSNNKSLANVDMVVGWVDAAQKIIIQDRHGDAHQPLPDQQQTIANLRGVRVGQMTTLQFTRRQRSGDDKDVHVDDVNCPYFVFPVRGGAYDTFTMKIQPHVDDPEMSDVGVCITKCAETAMVDTTPVHFMTTTTPASAAPTRTAVAGATTQKPAVNPTTADESEDDADSTAASAKKSVAVSGNTGGHCANEGAVVSLNPCQNCSCQKGVIQCVNVVCKDTFLQHQGCTPLFKVGVCCPEWQCPNQPPATTAAPRSALLTTLASVANASPTTTHEALAARKQAIGTEETADSSDNSESDQLIPDKMGVVTPSAAWLERQRHLPTSTAAGLQDEETSKPAVAVGTASNNGCLNFACGANATCVIADPRTGAPSCVCKPGFEGNAKIACVLSSQKSGLNSCRFIKCGKNAQCYALNGQPQCKCMSGFNGDPKKACDEQITGGFVQPFECQLRGEIGGCQNFGMRWQYDSRISGCRQFVYSGCAGNENNFENRQQCEQRCMPPRRLFKEQQCASNDDVDNPACARCECTEQGHVACTPLTCGGPPNRDCKALPVAGECCPKFDCSFVNATQDAPAVTESRSALCPGVMCREPTFRAGCTRAVVPGECCPSIQCNTRGNVEEEEETSTKAAETAVTTAARGTGVPCTADDKISSSNPCLSCQCVNGLTNCSQIMCPPITPEQRRKCRISQLANQCCLSVECPVVPTTTVAVTLPTLPTTTTLTTSTKAATTAATTPASTRAAPEVTAKVSVLQVTAKPAAAPPAGKPGCSEPADTGVCHAEITRWYLNPATGVCQTFVYSGCGGNKNRYLTEERCKAACK